MSTVTLCRENILGRESTKYGLTPLGFVHCIRPVSLREAEPLYFGIRAFLWDLDFIQLWEDLGE